MGKLWAKVRGLTQALITVANSNTSPINSNLTNSAYPPSHTFSPTLETVSSQRPHPWQEDITVRITCIGQTVLNTQ